MNNQKKLNKLLARFITLLVVSWFIMLIYNFLLYPNFLTETLFPRSLKYYEVLLIKVFINMVSPSRGDK